MRLVPTSRPTAPTSLPSKAVSVVTGLLSSMITRFLQLHSIRKDVFSSASSGPQRNYPEPWLGRRLRSLRRAQGLIITRFCWSAGADRFFGELWIIRFARAGAQGARFRALCVVALPQFLPQNVGADARFFGASDEFHFRRQGPFPELVAEFGQHIFVVSEAVIDHCRRLNFVFIRQPHRLEREIANPVVMTGDQHLFVVYRNQAVRGAIGVINGVLGTQYVGQKPPGVDLSRGQYLVE